MRRVLPFIAIGTLCVLSLVFAAWVVLARWTPEREIQRMLLEMSRVQTFRESVGVNWRREANGFSTTVYANGQVSLVDPDRIEHATRFRAVRLGNKQAYADLSGELRTIANTTYLTYVPPGPSVPGVDFALKGAWISFQDGELPSWGAVIPGLDAPVVSEIEGGASEWRGWDAAGVENLRIVLARADMFHVSYADLTELIHGVNTRIIDARLDPEAFRSVLFAVVRAREGRDLTDAERLAVEHEAAAFDRLTYRLWIGVTDHRLYRLQAAGAMAEEGTTELTPVDFRIEFSDFDAPFEGEVPSSGETLSFETILHKTLAGLPSSEMMGSTRLKDGVISDDAAHLPLLAIDTALDVDHDGLDAVLETFYGTDPNQADTDGDGTSDGEEVGHGKNPRGKGSLFGFGLGTDL